MLAKSLLMLAALAPLPCSACSDQKPQGGPERTASAGSAGADKSIAGAGGSIEAGGASGNGGAPGGAAIDDDLLITPEGLQVTAHPGGCGALSLTALTLSRGASHGELYVALRNDRDTPACSPAFSVELFDKSEQSLATGLGGLLVRHFYRLTDGSGTVAACVSPGDVTMVAITDLPSDLAIEDVGRVEYWCNYWALDVEPIGGIRIDDVRAVARGRDVAYTGTLFNELDVALSSPSVAIFQVNSVGRPLGVAHGSGTVELAPGQSWSFETSTVSVAGVDHADYPASGP